MNSGALWVYPRLGCSVFAYGQGRLAQVLTLSTAALMRITPNRWALDWAHVPQNVRCDNLYDAALDKTGVSIWAISWAERSRRQRNSRCGEVSGQRRQNCCPVWGGQPNDCAG